MSVGYVSGTTNDCVALNKVIEHTSSMNDLGRFVGGNYGGTLSGNYARDDMAVTTGGSYSPSYGTTQKDGADCSDTDWSDAGW